MTHSIRTLIIVFLLSLCTQLMAQQDQINAQKQIIATLEKQVANGERELAKIRKDKSASEAKLPSLIRQIEQRNDLLSAQRKQEDLIRKEVDRATKRSEELMRELKAEREIYARMVRDSYQSYKHNSFLSYIFTSRDFIDMARRVVNMRSIANLRAEKMEHINELNSEVEKERAQLVTQQKELEKVTAGLARQKANLERDIASIRQDIKRMSSKERQNLQQSSLQKKRLDSEIAKLRTMSHGNKEGATFSSRTSNLNLPVENGRVKRYMDNMAEISGPQNARIKSIYEGRVVGVSYNRISGKYDVFIAHGEYISSYAGLAVATVSKGDKIAKNQVIGTIGATVNISTLKSEYKIVFGIYPPNANTKMRASDCFKK